MLLLLLSGMRAKEQEDERALSGICFHSVSNYSWVTRYQLSPLVVSVSASFDLECGALIKIATSNCSRSTCCASRLLCFAFQRRRALTSMKERVSLHALPSEKQAV